MGGTARRALASLVFGIWGTIFFGVEAGPACGGTGSNRVFGPGRRRRAEKMGRSGFRAEGSLTVRKALVFTLGNQIFGQGGDPPEPPLRLRTFLFIEKRRFSTKAGIFADFRSFQCF